MRGSVWNYNRVSEKGQRVDKMRMEALDSWCPRPGSNRHTLGRIRDFKSRASANSATRAHVLVAGLLHYPQRRRNIFRERHGVWSSRWRGWRYV